MIEFIMANKDQLVSIIIASMALGGLIVKLTPTKADDAWFKKISTFFGRFFGGGV